MGGSILKDLAKRNSAVAARPEPASDLAQPAATATASSATHGAPGGERSGQATTRTALRESTVAGATRSAVPEPSHGKNVPEPPHAHPTHSKHEASAPISTVRNERTALDSPAVKTTRTLDAAQDERTVPRAAPTVTEAARVSHKPAAPNSAAAVSEQPSIETADLAFETLESDGPAKVDLYKDVSEFGKIKKILTADDQWGITGEKRMQIAAIELENATRMALILTPRSVGGTTEAGVQQASLRVRLTKAGYTVRKCKATTEVFKQLDQMVREETEAREQNHSKYRIDFERLIAKAHSEEASDIHINYVDGHGFVDLRIHGEKSELQEADGEYMLDLQRVIYDSCATNDRDVKFTPSISQDAKTISYLKEKRTGRLVELSTRVNTQPGENGGVRMVLRMLPQRDDNFDPIPFQDLGYSAMQDELLREALGASEGALLLSGTTGSGKSVSMNQMIKHLAREANYTNQITTIEHPIEYRYHPRIAWQIPINEKRQEEGKNAFVEAIKSAMRGDPDVIGIGEIRDEETAELAVKAAITGHPLLSTVHASDAIAIMQRLKGLKVDKEDMAASNFVNALVYQKLLQKTCKACSLSLKEARKRSSEGGRYEEVTDAFIAKLTEAARRVDAQNRVDQIRVRGDGCDACKGRGIVGRTLAAEVVVPDLTMRRYFRDFLLDDARFYWIAVMGGRPAVFHGFEKVLDGDVCPLNWTAQLTGARKIIKTLDESNQWAAERREKEAENAARTA